MSTALFCVQIDYFAMNLALPRMAVDLDSNATLDLMPLISDNWTIHFKYRGEGEMPAEEKKKLADIVAKTHAKGRRLRCWATPESGRKPCFGSTCCTSRCCPRCWCC